MPILQFVQRAGRARLPLVCFLDLQMEYIADGRPLALKEHTPWSANCRELLAFARQQRIPIAHFRQLWREPLLNPATSFAGWIEEFRPRPSEMVFERALPSCYAASDFASMVEQIDDPTIVIAGLTGHSACLATAIEGYHKNHQVIYVGDASSTPSLGAFDAKTSHACVSAIIAEYAEVMSTTAAIRWLSSAHTSSAFVGGPN